MPTTRNGARFAPLTKRLAGALLAVLAATTVAVVAWTSPAQAWTESCDRSAGSFYIEYVAGVRSWTSRGMYMSRGQNCQIGKARLAMQTDGNVVVYDEFNQARWAASWYRPVIGRGAFLYMQADNNLVLYDRDGVALWASNTYTGVWGGRLAVQSDGNVVMYGPSWQVFWATNSAH